MRKPALPYQVHEEIEHVARPGKADAVRALVARAMRAYERGDFAEALGPALQAKGMAPRSASVRELLGLVHYKIGRWRDASRELAAYARMSGRREHDHLRADVERALGRPEHALEILHGLKASDVGDELVVEGLIVAAGALEDLGRHDEAVGVLRQGPLRPRVVLPYHLRLWYALADALEKAGRRAESREWWDLIYAEDPEFFDVAERRLRRC
jgi:tetratricopeptide (TPR) repeat protein